MPARTSRTWRSSQPISTASSSASCARARNSARFSLSTLIFSTQETGSPSGVCQTGKSPDAVSAIDTLYSSEVPVTPSIRYSIWCRLVWNAHADGNSLSAPEGGEGDPLRPCHLDVPGVAAFSPPGGGFPGASPSAPFLLPGAEKIIWPIRFSRLIEDWVYLMRPPGGMTLSEPPGTNDRYLSPKRPAETILATVSSGSLTAGSMLIRKVARKLFG